RSVATRPAADVPGGQPTDDQQDPGPLASERTPEPEADKSRPEPEQSAPAAKKKKKSFGRELLTIVVAAAVLTLLVKAFIVQVYRIPSASMENTLQVGDRVLVNKVVYHFRDIARGDVIVFSGQDSWGPDALQRPGGPDLRRCALRHRAAEQPDLLHQAGHRPAPRSRGVLHRREGDGQRRSAERGLVPVSR